MDTKKGKNMRSKVKIITSADHEFTEFSPLDTYESVKSVCDSKHEIFRPEKMVKIGRGYDYQMKNGNIVLAEQIP